MVVQASPIAVQGSPIAGEAAVRRNSNSMLWEGLEGIRRYPGGTQEAFVGILEAFGGIWRCLEVFGRRLEAPGRSLGDPKSREMPRGW